ncbi:hypothetical protein VKT23_015210 [Stygiomarasmius scandens]|uniref:Uncharacterized protein n=1 Tax=Marasmiellus scandens TaxID=2682957 RepID=A0ABR1IY90_9AGAR
MPKGKHIGVSRSVQLTTGGGQFGLGGQSSSVLNMRELAQERQKAKETYSLNVQGLSADSRRTLDELAGDVGEETLDTYDSDPMDIDTRVMAGNDDEAEDALNIGGETFVYAVRDLIQGNKWSGHRWRKDGRTWRRRIQAMDEQWSTQLEDMTDAYIQWKYTSGTSYPSDLEYDFEISTINLYTLERTIQVARDAHTEPNVALVRAGYLGNSPVAPSIAVSLKTLELFHVLRLFKASFSIEAFAKVLCHLYKLEDEPELLFSRMWVIDSNNSLKRIKGINGREVADTRVFTDSTYYLPAEFVDSFAHEVHIQTTEATDQDSDDEEPGDNVNMEGDPTDGGELEAEAEKMLKGAKYPLALVAKALEVFGENWIIGYDIGCRFASTIKSTSLGQRFQDKGCRTCVNAFHGYTHNILCQQQNHPLNITGMGLEDLETLERIFSASNQLASLTRYMSAYRRRVFIDLYFQQWDVEKYNNLATMIHNNYVQALSVIDEDSAAVRDALETLCLTEKDLDNYFNDEIIHFQQLSSEAPEDVHAVAYVELLQKLQSLNSQYKNASNAFCLQIPEDYQPLSGEQQYSSGLSATRRMETERRRIGKDRDHIQHEVIEMEVQMGIEHRWEPSSAQYLQAMKYMKTRKYQQALEHLHKLIIQRLFELHRLNLNQTGYKMRAHIAQALQKRSKAIRNAVKRYNTAATALDPPRPTLDWSKVSHFSFLDEFNILQDTRHSVFDKPWAQPVIRETMERHRRLTRAREEIVRCNVELHRLHTSIVDEDRKFSTLLSQLENQNSPVYGPVQEYVVCRRGAHTLLLEQIHRTYALEGFTGTPSPGTRKGCTDVGENARELHINYDRTTRSEDDEGWVDKDDELTTGLGAVVDYISNISLQG